MNTTKKTILIDLDGVLNTYQGKFNPEDIPPIRAGAFEFIKDLYNEDFELKLFTTRNKILASKWLIKNNLDLYFTDVTSNKDVCWLFIDDRCLQFNGDYSEMSEKIKNFKAWYK